MKLTDIFKFKKPEQTDTYNIDDQNNNWDAAENALKECDKSYGLLSNISLLEWSLEQTNGGTFVADASVSDVPQAGNWQGMISISSSGDRGIFLHNGNRAYYVATTGSSFQNCTWVELANANHSHASVPALTTARTIDGVNFNGSVAISHYGTCSTTGATVAKTVWLANFTLVTGARVIVRFTYANTASSPTLNVNGTGAKLIKYRNSAIESGLLVANGVYEFVYDGTDWELVGEIVKGAASTITSSNLTVNRALMSNASGKVAVSPVTSTELECLDGVTENIQTQFNNLNKSCKWHQWKSEQKGTGGVDLPDILATTDIMIIANINAASANNDAESAVMLQVIFPITDDGLVTTRLRTGYFQECQNYGGLAKFYIDLSSDMIKLQGAILNGKDVTATTTWTVYYKWNGNF